jgi:hypothetical protein
MVTTLRTTTSERQRRPTTVVTGPTPRTDIPAVPHTTVAWASASVWQKLGEIADTIRMGRVQPCGPYPVRRRLAGLPADAVATCVLLLLVAVTGVTYRIGVISPDPEKT